MSLVFVFVSLAFVLFTLWLLPFRFVVGHVFFRICQNLKTNAREINKRWGRGSGENREAWLGARRKSGVCQTFFLCYRCDLWPTKLTRRRGRWGGGKSGRWAVPFTCATWSCPCHRRHQQRLLLSVRRNFWNYNLIWMSLKFSRSPLALSNAHFSAIAFLLAGLSYPWQHSKDFHWKVKKEDYETRKTMPHRKYVATKKKQGWKEMHLN